MAEIRGVKRLGPKPKFAPIIVKHEEKPPVVVATFLENHIRRGTVQRDDLYTGVKFGMPAAGNKRVHPAEDSGRRPAGTPKRVHRSWTDEESETIKRMYRHGHTVKEIAEELGRTWQSTNKQLIRLRKEDPSIPFSTRKGNFRKENYDSTY